MPDPVRWCRKCDRPDQNLALRSMARREPGTVGWHSAMTSWSPEPCECAEPDWEVDDDD